MNSPNFDGDDKFKAGSLPRQDPLSHPGERLRERREMQKLSLEIVATQLHTTVQMVRALEENDLAKLPPPVFVRGFLRSYARLVDLPESEVLGAVPTPPATLRPTAGSSGAAPAVPLYAEAESRPALTVFLALGALAATAFIGWQLWNGRLAADRKTEVGTPAPASASEQSEVSADLLLTPQATTAPIPAGVTAEPHLAEAPPPTAPLAQPVPAPAPLSEPIPPPVAPERARTGASPPPANALVLRFAGESWVTVVDAAGKRLLYEAGLPGTSKTVSGQPPLKVTLGRPGNVSLEFNGQPVANSYNAKSGPARFTVGG